MATNPKKITVINKVSDAQLETLTGGGTITKGSDSLTGDEGAIYLTPEVIDSTPTANSTNLVTSGGVKTYADTKLDKITSTSSQYRTYIIKPDGSQTTWEVSEDVAGGRVVARNTGGQVKVPLTPTSSEHATSKQYVDNLVGVVENYTVTTWATLASSEPYTHSATVTATTTINANTIVELFNNQAVLFATYGFAIGSISGQSVTIYSIGEPSSSVDLTIRYGG